MPNSRKGKVVGIKAGRLSIDLQGVLRQLPMGGAEQRAIEAGEIDAVVDYASARIIVFPAARRALRLTADRAAAVRDAKLKNPVLNSLLAALSDAAYQQLLPALKHVKLASGDVLYEPGVPIEHVYFPTDCVVCRMSSTDGQRAVATGLVGYEGVLGISLTAGVSTSSVRAEVLIAGNALRIPVKQFKSEFQRQPQLQRQLYRYAHAALDQAMQIAACFATQNIEQSVAYFLLMISDRARSPEIHLTHAHLATLLNVRRVTITLCCNSLRSRGLIEYSRGRMKILDRKELESVSHHAYRSPETAVA